MSSNDELKLPMDLQRLEIQSCTEIPPIIKTMPNLNTNPFKRREYNAGNVSTNLFGTECRCGHKHSNQLKAKRPIKKSAVKSKILKEPVLLFINNCHSEKTVGTAAFDTTAELGNLMSTASDGDLKVNSTNKTSLYDFKSLLSSCSELSSPSTSTDYSNLCFKQRRMESHSNISNSNSTELHIASELHSTSCSQQAMMNTSPPCDVTIDELASYFETFVHIPKKMSSMAEMMYI